MTDYDGLVWHPDAPIYANLKAENRALREAQHNLLHYFLSVVDDIVRRSEQPDDGYSVAVALLDPVLDSFRTLVGPDCAGVAGD